MISASLQNYRISPRKVRLVADMIRGKNVAQAKVILANVNKKSKHPLSALLDSAVANAKNNFKIDQELVVKEIRVDQGYILKRSIPMARGSAFPIKKRTSHVSVVLAPEVAKKDKKSDKKSAKKVTKAEKK